MTPKSGNRFPACANLGAVQASWFDASVGGGRSEKIMLERTRMTIGGPKNA
jgi:hypothetical protein